jgi:hypothetical protein
MKFELNLPFNEKTIQFGSQEFIDIAYNAAAESITLLKKLKCYFTFK